MGHRMEPQESFTKAAKAPEAKGELKRLKCSLNDEEWIEEAYEMRARSLLAPGFPCSRFGPAFKGILAEALHL